MKPIALGKNNFKEIIENNYCYVDKTLLIQELANDNSAVILLPRPRRFGKTLNLSMLYYFYSNTEQAAHLFKNLAIVQDSESMLDQGVYPTVFITFKDIKFQKWEESWNTLREVIAKLFEDYREHIHNHLSEFERNFYQEIISKKNDMALFSRSLYQLTAILQRIYKKEAIVLIDEYDAPIHAGYQYGYYNEIIHFMRAFLGSALKDNAYLKKGILTGILRTAKESIFSGLNNLSTYTILDELYCDKFGFTQREVDAILDDFQVQDKKEEVASWYNGYRFAGITIYNPWSIMQYLKQRKFATYWVNTSDNALVKHVLLRASDSVYDRLEKLLHSIVYNEPVDDYLTFPDLEHYNDQAVWSLLLLSGYLTAIKQETRITDWSCDLAIPNIEIRAVYEKMLTDRLYRSLQGRDKDDLLPILQRGDGARLAQILQDYIKNSLSFHDLGDNASEKSYHLFILGILVAYSKSYHIRSNRESGHGRYDIMLIPHNKKDLGVIIEFKKSSSKKDLNTDAESALNQIHVRQYASELRGQNIENIVALGIAFHGKDLVLKQDLLN